MPTVLSRRPGGGGGTGAGPAGPTGATGPTGTGGGLPTGWTQEDDPAFVWMNGGGIATGAESDNANGFFTGAEIELTDDNGDTIINIGNTDGVSSMPSDNAECFEANGTNGATVALRCHALPVTEVADPTDAQDAATKNYADTAHVAAFVDPSTGSAEDIANALIAAGLMAPS